MAAIVAHGLVWLLLLVVAINKTAPIRWKSIGAGQACGGDFESPQIGDVGVVSGISVRGDGVGVGGFFGTGSDAGGGATQARVDFESPQTGSGIGVGGGVGGTHSQSHSMAPTDPKGTDKVDHVDDFEELSRARGYESAEANGDSFVDFAMRRPAGGQPRLKRSHFASQSFSRTSSFAFE